MREPMLRAMSGRAWRYAVVSASALGATASLGVLADAGWTLEQAALGAVIAGALLGLAGILVQQQVRKVAVP